MTIPTPDAAPVNPPAAPVAVPDPVGVAQDVIAAATDALERRGYLKTEYWTGVIAVFLAIGIAKAGVSQDSATQVAAVLAPILFAVAFNVLRIVEKKALATLASRLPL